MINKHRRTTDKKIKNRKNRQHRKHTISIMYLLFGFISVAIVGFLLFYSLSTLMIKESVQSSKQSVDQSGKYVEVYIDNLKSISTLLSENTDVVELFSHKNELTKEQYEERINLLIANVLQTNKSIKSIVIISKDGNVFSNEAGLDMTMSEDMMKEAWYVNAIHSEMPRLTSARMQSFSMDKDSWVISISKEIVDQYGENIGVVVLDIPYTTIESYLMHLEVGENGTVFILNSENEVVFHKDSSYYEDDTLIQKLVDLKNEKVTYSASRNTLVSQYEIINTDWTLVGAFEVESIPIIKRQIVEIIIVGFVFIFLGVIFTTIILNRLTVELKSREELFHKQEMDVLYSQINPHFLYNTLDTIIWQAEFNQSEDVILTTKSLAQFFRLSLNQGEKLITLRDEIEHVKQYLYIQKQRYQEKLNYDFKVEESLLDRLVPKIILQPIVENCIYHGIRELDREGMITLTFSKVKNSENEFDIEIKDDGVGFQYNNEKNKFPQSNKKRLGGVGLQNLNQRIQLYCGNKYGLEIHSVPDQGTVVILHLSKIEKII